MIQAAGLLAIPGLMNTHAHVPMVLVGDARTGAWTRLNGFPAVDRIVEKVDELLAARARTASVAR